MGDAEAKTLGTGYNEMASLVSELGGLQKLEELQQHKNEEIYNKVRNPFLLPTITPATISHSPSPFCLMQVIRMIEAYFGVEEETEMNLAPQMAGPNGTFSFGGPGVGGPPTGGFNFQQMH